MRNETPTLSIRDLVLLKSNPQKFYMEHLEETKSYSHKPHLASLPHDRRTNDPEKLQERIDEIKNRLKECEKRHEELASEYVGWDNELKEIEKELSLLAEDKETHKQNYEDSQNALRETFKELNPLIDEIRKEEEYYESGPQMWGEADSRIYDYLDAVNELEDIANIDLNGTSSKTAYELINEKFKKSKLYDLLDDDKKDYTLSGAVNELGRKIRTEHNPQNPTLNGLLRDLGDSVEEMGNYDGIVPRYGEVSDMMDFEYSAEMYGKDRSESNISTLNSRKEELEGNIAEYKRNVDKLLAEEKDYRAEWSRTANKKERVTRKD